MRNITSIVLLAVLFFTGLAVKSEAIEGVQVTNEKQLADFVKVLLGQNHEAMSEDLKQFVATNKISIVNAAEGVVLMLNEMQKTEENANNFEITSKFFSLLGKSNSKLNIEKMIGSSEENSQETNGQSGKKVHNLYLTKGQIEKITKKFQAHQRRLLAETTQSAVNQEISFSYITKFFFGLLFIIVCLCLFFSIACMENKKDTLLYAKFIADVGR